jgi:hypothetical protein
MLISSNIVQHRNLMTESVKDSIKETKWFGNDVELRKLNKREKICCEKSGNLFILSIFCCVNILLSHFYGILYKEFVNYYDYVGIR